MSNHWDIHLKLTYFMSTVIEKYLKNEHTSPRTTSRGIMWRVLFIIMYQCFGGSTAICTNQRPNGKTEIWQTQARWDTHINTSLWLSLDTFPYITFFSVTLTFRSRAKFELSPDFKSWASKWMDALKASSGKKLKIKSRKCASPES